MHMVAEQKNIVISAWNRHIDGLGRQHKHSRFSSVAEAAFCETFKTGVNAHRSLTKKEKTEIFAYANL